MRSNDPSVALKATPSAPVGSRCVLDLTLVVHGRRLRTEPGGMFQRRCTPIPVAAAVAAAAQVLAQTVERGRGGARPRPAASAGDWFTELYGTGCSALAFSSTRCDTVPQHVAMIEISSGA